MVEMLEHIADLRGQNFQIYRRMASEVDADAVGFVPRQPGNDATLALIEKFASERPELARQLLLQIAENDEEIARLTRLYAFELTQ